MCKWASFYWENISLSNQLYLTQTRTNTYSVALQCVASSLREQNSGHLFLDLQLCLGALINSNSDNPTGNSSGDDNKKEYQKERETSLTACVLLQNCMFNK